MNEWMYHFSILLRRLRSKRKVFTWNVSNCQNSPILKSALYLTVMGLMSDSPKWLQSKQFDSLISSFSLMRAVIENFLIFLSWNSGSSNPLTADALTTEFNMTFSYFTVTTFSLIFMVVSNFWSLADCFSLVDFDFDLWSRSSGRPSLNRDKQSSWFEPFGLRLLGETGGRPAWELLRLISGLLMNNIYK